MLGKPIGHSKSPQLHLAAYRALGLHDWTYERIECDADQLPGVVGGFGPEWVGVSVTMPGKFAALRFADERTEQARRVGSANTLVRTATGWRADNTDIDGVAGALGAASGWALVCGSGGTAPAAVAGLAQLGVAGITVNPDKAARLVRLGDELGVPTRFCALDGAGLGDEPRPRCWSAPCRRRWPNAMPAPWRASACCSTPSTTPGPPRWPPR